MVAIQMKKLLLKVTAVFLPWLILLIKDNPGGAFVALILQASLIGWIPAAMWALNALKEEKPNKTA